METRTTNAPERRLVIRFRPPTHARAEAERLVAADPRWVDDGNGLRAVVSHAEAIELAQKLIPLGPVHLSPLAA